ncbi:RES domain-containing protein [Mycobacterium sp. BK086]|uniref:RES domain-containing protein n=1 Tax=Mycobacterium sp. BK086 TaxID=2512165 RepID=UPI00105E6FEB|nr:RES domain-containing protein [Mycobacterium sp. BK086]TDO14621.1 RES domain-containing protein [Mycobacterium sp. BK086]
MGVMKNRQIDLSERGFGEVDGGICLAHITDACLVSRLEESVADYECRICDRAEASDAGTPFAVPVEELMHVVAETVRHFYTPASAVLPRDSEDGSLVGPQDETWDVVADITVGAFEDDHVDAINELISDAIGYEDSWTSWFADGDVDGLEFAWTQFMQIAMHESRMIVGLGATGDPPGKLANFLNSVLLYVESDLGLVTQLPMGSAFYRGRLCEDAGSLRRHSDDLGPAPRRRARSANRMSPAGVALFYASGDPQTALAEIAGHGIEPLAVIGKFTNTRELRILDLTRSPRAISPFCLDKREHARMARFLTSFVSYITAPVIPDERQHVEYAPTQLLTEYLRWVPEPKLDGIALPSAQTGNSTYVLFLGREDCATVDDPAAANEVHDPYDLGSAPTLLLDPEAVITYRVGRQYSGVDAGPWNRARPPWPGG